MPKKAKGKTRDDDWEAESEAIAEANRAEVPAAAEGSSRLDRLFADAIARGKRTDGEYDRATDGLASGARTEDELIRF